MKCAKVSFLLLDVRGAGAESAEQVRLRRFRGIPDGGYLHSGALPGRENGQRSFFSLSRRIENTLLVARNKGCGLLADVFANLQQISDKSR